MSRLASESERRLIDSTQRLSPEERLNAFLRHARLLAQLHAVGTQQRAAQEPRKP
ncbi:MAG TPA: hypothetical protein VMB48_05455 [Steroidobacteraceae bacterium]|nr:hypothetical protein [Steroidobacteraceae bacterium]